MITDPAGLWTRSLLAWPDGRRDTTTRVCWLQGLAAFSDLRQPASAAPFSSARCLRELTMADCRNIAAQQGFAGVFKAGPDHCEWLRIVDLHPAAATADAGRLFWRDEVLVEEGVFEPYVEHWHRDAASRRYSCAALTLRSEEDGRWGSLLRVGDDFSFARDRQRPLNCASLIEALAGAADMAAARALVDVEISQGRTGPRGWRITRSSLPFRRGQRCGLTIREPDILSLSAVASDAEGGATVWRIVGEEGDPSIFRCKDESLERPGPGQPAKLRVPPYWESAR